ncbi:hypothetical protein [Mycobacterium sp.]|uniref:hypothetical protein n=1 Tax=Mycobacterium sp. TaxID=1785 RepID=UPI003C76365E
MESEQDPPKGGETEGPAGHQAKPAAQPEDQAEYEDETDHFPSGGSIEYQDPETTKPRPPTPAELRARKKFAKKQEELEKARQEAEAKRRRQKRILMGSAAAVGVVGVVAGLGYWALSAPSVTAQCVQEDPNGQPVIVPDSYCTGHTPGLNGFFFFGGHQYRYYYGSSGSVGSRPIGGSTTLPKGATVTTKSGTTIQRGGLGGRLGGGSKGGGGS